MKHVYNTINRRFLYSNVINNNISLSNQKQQPLNELIELLELIKFTKNNINLKINNNHIKSLQYISDIHVDAFGINKIPHVNPKSENLAICGDIGNPKNKNVEMFLNQMSDQFKNVFIVPGNHDYNCSPIYNKKKVNEYKPYLYDVCSKFNNIVLLDNGIYELSDTILLAGTTLWSNPFLTSSRYNNHVDKHLTDIEWLKQIIFRNKNKNIIVLTHYVPTFKLIEQKFHNRNSDFFATDLEYMIKPPIIGWLCGHTHSSLECYVNGIYCGVNAYGYNYENTNGIIPTKVFYSKISN